MIAFVQGTIDMVSGNAAVIDAGGIGFEVLISEETAARLASLDKTEQVKLYTYLNVDREGAMSLIGFLSRDELLLFRQLITVNGVGPRAGLSLLSAIGADELRFAIVSGDAKAISKAPGIGKKTADRLVLELRDKLSKTAEAQEGSVNDALSAHAGSTEGTGNNSAENDAIMALNALGYTRMEAVNAVRKARKDMTELGNSDGTTSNAEDVPGNVSTEALLKMALKYLG